MMKAFRSLTFLTAALFIGACGGRDTASITAPTPSTSATPAPSASLSGATIVGTVVGVTTGAAFTTRAVNLTVTVNSSSVSSTVDASGRFTLNGVPAGHVELHFSGPGADARMGLDDVADHERIEVTVRVAGTVVEVDDSRRDKADDRVEIEGRVADVNVAARTLRIKDVVVSVPASASIHHGSTTLDLTKIKINDLVHVHAVKNGSALTAQEIESQTEHPEDNHGQEPGDDHGTDPGDHNAAETDLTGTVAIGSRACPAVTFTVATKTVTTNAATDFRNVTCATLANGDTVEVKGSTQPNGTVLATRVEKKK